MTPRARGFVVLCGFVPVLAAVLLCLYRPPQLANLEYSVYDVLLRATPRRPADARIVIVDVDERSLATVGQWPWGRDVVGALIDRLRNRGAAIVALDVIFAEADRFQTGSADTDADLAETLRGGRVVLGYAMTFGKAATGASACLQHPIGLALVRRGDDQSADPFFGATGSICNLPLLTQAAGASGFLNAAPDPDGILRRVPLLMELDGRVYPALSLATVVSALGTRDIALEIANVNTTSLVLGSRRVPLDGKSNLLIRYRGPKRTFPYVSATDVLSGAATADFKDKLVFVGTTALGTREVVATPLDTLFAGVEVQATAADNLLQQDFLRRPEYGVTLEAQTVLGLGIMAILLFGRFGLAWSAAGVAVCAAAAWAASAVLLAKYGTYVSPLFPTLGLGGALAAMTAARFVLEYRRANRAELDRATSQRLMVQSLLSLTEVRDAETGRHSRRTRNYTQVLARQLASDQPEYAAFLTPANIELLASLAPLHDIGKVGVPDRLLNKPGALTSEELEEMHRHPTYGRDVIVHAERDVGAHDDLILAMAKDIVYTHHEKWDGTGYPQGLRGADIPIAGRLIALVDVYDAVRTRRLYRPPVSHAEAVALIVKGRGTHFDPAVVDAFLAASPVIEALSTRDGGSDESRGER